MSNMVVRTNIYSLNAHRNMKNVGLEQKRASNRLSSGYRINSAADDAAGLAISETMRAQIRGLDQASRNAQDGQAMILTTEGGLDEIGNILQRVRELLVQASNDTNTQGQRDMIRQEINQLSQEIGSMQNRVEFNTNRVLAMGPAMDSVVLNDLRLLNADNVTVSDAFSAINANRSLISEAREALLAMNGLTVVSNGVTLAGNLSARMVSLLDRTFTGINFSAAPAPEGVAIPSTIAGSPGVGAPVFSLSVGGDVGAVVNHTISIGGVLHELSTSFSVAGGEATMTIGAGFNWVTMNGVAENGAGQVTVTDLITALNARADILDDAVEKLNEIRSLMSDETISIYDKVRDFRGKPSSGDNVAWFQVGANSGQGIQFDFEEVSRTVTAASAITNMAAIMVANPDNGGGIGSGIDVSPLVNMIQSSLDDVNSIRANLGAVQNRMDFTMRSLDISSENLQDSESRVRNADIAREMMRFTMANVLQQSSVSMLAQANQLPNNLLQLLR